MAGARNVPENPLGSHTFKEAVCVDSYRVYDSCADKDCPEGLQVYFTDKSQTIIDNSASVKLKEAELIEAFIEVEPLSFNKGFYCVDIMYYFRLGLCAFKNHLAAPTTVNGVCIFSKRVILFGSESKVRTFSSNGDHSPKCETAYKPVAKLQCAEPMVLDLKLADCRNDDGQRTRINMHRSVEELFEGDFDSVVPVKEVRVTLGLFSIVSLERRVQLMVPCYDFAVPDKESISAFDEPNELFKRVKFPVDDFFPHKLREND